MRIQINIEILQDKEGEQGFTKKEELFAEIRKLNESKDVYHNDQNLSDWENQNVLSESTNKSKITFFEDVSDDYGYIQDFHDSDLDSLPNNAFSFPRRDDDSIYLIDLDK